MSILPPKGSRIELVHTDDPYTRLRPGDRGVVTGHGKALDVNQLHVIWDDGSTLTLLADVDDWRVLTLGQARPMTDQPGAITTPDEWPPEPPAQSPSGGMTKPADPSDTEQTNPNERTP